jgi:hypothetical protein
MTLNIQKFDISSIPGDSVVVFLGRRRVGKSTGIKDLLYYQRDTPVATIISATEQANRFYGNFIPNVFIHHDYSEALIESVVNRQKKLKEKVEKTIKKKGQCDIDQRAILVLDDMMFDTSWIKDKNIRLLFMNGRHWNMLFLIALQFPLGITPTLRSNIDYVFIYRENNINNRKRLYENYASVFPTFEMFCIFMDSCTENYECLVIKVNSSSNKLTDQVFWYKSTRDLPPFKLGAREFWDAQKEKEEDSEEEEEEEMFDISQYNKKKNKLKLSINKKH